MDHTITHDPIYLYRNALVVALQGPKRVASSSLLNGGCHDGMAYLYNYSYSHSPLVQNKIVCAMEAPNLEVHYQQLTQQLGLPLETTVAMGTAASLKERATVTLSFKGIAVQAIVTAGIDHNGGRAGDPPSYDELTGESLFYQPGTINIMLWIDAQLPPGVLNQAIITTTEAKSVALQELQAGSHYSHGIATGSGTDTVMVISNLQAPHTLYDAGQHSQLGATIGQVIIQATKEALSYHGDGMTAERQGTLLWQGYRFGINPQALAQSYISLYSTPPDPHQLQQWLQNPQVLAYTAPLLHLLEQREWGLISPQCYSQVARQYLQTFLDQYTHEPLAHALAQLLPH